MPLEIIFDLNRSIKFFNVSTRKLPKQEFLTPTIRKMKILDFRVEMEN